MNRTKSILLGATALAMFSAPQVASAQSATVVFLPRTASQPSASCIVPAVAETGTSANTLSGDGQIVVGFGNRSACANAWRNGVPQLLNDPNSNPTVGGIVQASSTNTDGSIIVGDARGTGFGSGYNQTTIWTATTGFYNPPEVVAGSRQALGAGYVNANGTYFAFNVSDYSRNAISGDFSQYSGRIAAYRWSPVNGYEAIGSLGSRYDMVATGIDGAGSAIAGTAIDPATGTDRIAFVWRAASGLTSLSHLSNNPAGGVSAASTAEAISRDGTTIVGRSLDANGFSQAAFWRNGTITGLGFLPGLSPTQTGLFADHATKAQAVNADGSMIVGTTGSGFQNPTSLAWRWTSASGMQDLNLFATNAGINLGGYMLTDAVGLSDNGQYITGNSFNAAQSQYRGYALSIAAAPPPASGTVSFLAGASSGTAGCSVDADAGSESFAISGDGHFVVGAANSNCLVAWRDGAPQLLDTLSPLGRNGVPIEYASGMSSDGSVIVGSRDSSSNLPFRAPTFIWTATTGSYLAPEPIAGSRRAVGDGYVNSDGTIFAFNTLDYTVSSGENINSGLGFVYRWSAAGGFQEIGRVNASFSMFAHGIDGSGNAIVGVAENPSTFGDPFGPEARAFVWRTGSGETTLPDLSSAPPVGTNRYSDANGISRDGTTIVGQSRGADGRLQGVYWRGGVITGLGWLPGASPADSSPFAANVTQALAANATGDIIVGKAIGSSNDLAWRWTAASGMQDLNLFATNAGINLNGYVLTDAVGLSDNGQYITGNSFNAAQSQYRGYVLSIAAAPITPTTLTTSARLIVTLTLPGVTQTSIVNQTFSTQVDAKLNGATVFTRTVGDQITGSLGVTALADARTSLQQTSGLRRVVIGAPVLISNTTTVQSSTSNTVNVSSGTQVTTAAVVTNGPATVATGDLGTCATAATTGVNPTGCSLPGTPVTVNTNVINTNTFTNTINSVTPTTTTTVNQLISAKWQVSATAGNQFGTVHALSGVAAFDRGDRLIGQLLSMGGGQSSGSDRHVARAAMPMRDANGLGGEGSGLTIFGSYFGNWSHTDADASVPVADVKGSTNGFVLGLEKSLGATRVGVAVDHGTSNYTVRDATYPETLSLKHTQVALFAGWNSGGFSLDGAAAYGFGTARTSLTTPTTPATASRDVRSWSLGAQAGYTVPLGKAASVELVGGVRHVSANLRAFTESGGPSPLLGHDQTVHRTRAYAGIEAQAGIALGSVTLTPRIHARYAHDSGDASGTADLLFVSAPNGPVMQALGPGVGRDVAELGGSLDAAVGGNVHVWAGYDGTFRDGAQSHAAKAGVTVAF